MLNCMFCTLPERVHIMFNNEYVFITVQKKKAEHKPCLTKIKSHKIICVEQKKGDNKTDVNIEI